MRASITHLSIVLSLLVACDRSASKQPVVIAEDAPTPVHEPPPLGAEARQVDEESAASSDAEAVRAAERVENSAEQTAEAPIPSHDKNMRVRAIPFDAQEFPSELPNGHVDGGIAFIDSAGVNYVVFTLDAPLTREHIRRTTLHIKHVVDDNGVTREVRSYVERIDDCDFDVIVKPYYGEWSITDVNNNGIAEVSFAYTADCVADISPFAHKALITEAGEKYALRGFTFRQYPDGFSEGGSYKADTMPPLFLKKVKKVWHRTSQQ